MGEAEEKPGPCVGSEGKEPSAARAGSRSRLLLSAHVDMWNGQTRAFPAPRYLENSSGTLFLFKSITRITTKSDL